MKKLTYVFVAICIILSLLIVPVMAVSSKSEQTIHYSDGSYAIVTLDRNITRANVEDTKTYTFYNPLGQRCFAYTLYASFTYNGVTSHADSCDFSIVIYRQGWNVSTHSEYVSGNTAYGNATFTGPENQVRTANLTLTCDKNGKVS